MTKHSVRRAVALLGIALAWVVSAFVSFAALLSAWMGRVNWGDGRPRDSVALTAAFVVLAVIVPIFAAWLTRVVWRRTSA